MKMRAEYEELPVSLQVCVCVCACVYTETRRLLVFNAICCVVVIRSAVLC